MENFRPNVAVSGAYPWDEDNWENILFCRPGTDIHGKSDWEGKYLILERCFGGWRDDGALNIHCIFFLKIKMSNC